MPKEPLLTLIHAFALRGEVESALELYNSVTVLLNDEDNVDNGIVVDQNVYNQMCGAFQRTGRLEDLADFMLRHQRMVVTTEEEEEENGEGSTR